MGSVGEEKERGAGEVAREEWEEKDKSLSKVRIEIVEVGTGATGIGLNG